MRRTSQVLTGALVVVACLGATAASASAEWKHRGGHEVWAIDQSNTTADGGGTLYVYEDAALRRRSVPSRPPDVVDLGGAARGLCLEQTGSAPVRPHMLAFNAAQSHAILAFVASGHVLFIDAASRTPVDCIDAGVQAHAAFPTPDEEHVIVANQNGKLLQRIATSFETNEFVLENGATLNLATCSTPNGDPCEAAGLRPDNAPICPVIDSTGRFTFVTLRGGGMFVVDSTATPMRIVAEYDAATVHPNGCGGVERAGTMFVNAGGGTPANPLESDLYAFPAQGYQGAPKPRNTPAPSLVFSHDDRGFVDSHGTALTKHGRYLWVADRAANRIVVVDARRATVVNEIELAGSVSPDPAPDLLAAALAGNRVYASLRGPAPLTANVAGVNNAVGATPGVGVLEVTQGGRSGRLRAVAPISHPVGGVEMADPHAIAVRATGRSRSSWKPPQGSGPSAARAGESAEPAGGAWSEWRARQGRWDGAATDALCRL